MPCSVVAADELDQFATSSNEEMGGHFNATQMVEIWMALVLQLVGEEVGHIVAAIFTWGQADGVNHHQVNFSACRARTKIR